MPALLLNKWVLIGLAVVAFSITQAMALNQAKQRGIAECQQAQVEAQAEHDRKVKKTYDKIDKKTPFGAGQRDAVEWLRQYVRGSD